MSHKYKPPPFNYCDYRCEQCDEREHCRVYKDNEERILNHYIKGEDPHDPQIFFNDLKEIFAKTKNMIKDMAAKKGINLENLPDEETSDDNPEEYVIYRLSHEYFLQASRFIKELKNKSIPKSIEGAFQDFVWYNTLISAKAGRLVSGFVDDILDEEMRKIEEEGTLQVLNKSINFSQHALQKLLHEVPDCFSSIVDLMGLLKKLAQQMQTDIRQKVDQKDAESE